MSVIDNLPPALRASTTGQGLAGLIAAGAVALTSHYTANPVAIGLSGVIVGAIVLLFFPQATGASPASTLLANDIRPLLLSYEAGLKHGAAIVQPVAAETAGGIGPAPPSLKK